MADPVRLTRGYHLFATGLVKMRLLGLIQKGSIG
jgi:hypothetical protein